MPFFKKNKSEARKRPPILEENEPRVDLDAKDASQNLDQQIEELTAKLNLTNEDNGTAKAILTPGTMASLKPSSPHKSQIGSTDDFNLSLSQFEEPKFSAELSSNARPADVAPPPAPKTGQTAIDEAVLAPPPMPAPLNAGPSRLNMSELRVDVAKISSDIQSGEQLYRRALQRVEGLMGQVEKAEIDFSVLNRLEPENRRLKARLRTVQSEFEDKKNKFSILEADLVDHRERLEEKTAQYENAQARLTTSTKSLREYERVLKQTKEEAERFALALDRHKTALDVEGRESKVLREKVSDLSDELELRQNNYLEASKAAESLRVDCEDYRDQTETLRAETQDLRIALNTAKRQNNAMKGEMLALHEDIKTFKTEYEFNVIHREDQVNELESEVSTLRKAIDQKDEISLAQSAELSSLRKLRVEQDVERDRLEHKLETAGAEMTERYELDKKHLSSETQRLNANIESLQAEIKRRDEMSEHSAKDTQRLHYQISELQKESDDLKTLLDIEKQKAEQSALESPVSALEAKISALEEQLSIKDEIVQGAAKDIQELRRQREADQEEQARLEARIQDQSFQIESTQKDLRSSQEAASNLDQRYKDVAAALSVNTARQKSSKPAENPDITPDISDSAAPVSEDEVADRIIDYKLGLRSDIA